MSALLTISGGDSSIAFQTNLFTFKMLPPQILEYNHMIQNGDTLIDRISFKDKFEIELPYVQQTDYNNLMSILQSTSSPFLTVDYKTDTIERLWDGVTVPSIDTAIFSLTPVYILNDDNQYGILTEQATVNYFTNPSGEDLSTTGLTAEDGNIIVTNTSSFALFGNRSFKVANSSAADWAASQWSALMSDPINDNIGRPGYITSGAISIGTTQNNFLLYTASGPDNPVWVYNNCVLENSAWPARIRTTSDIGYLEQVVTNTDGHTDVIFSVRFKAGLDGIDYTSSGVVQLQIRKTSTDELRAILDIPLNSINNFGVQQYICTSSGDLLNDCTVRIYPDTSILGAGIITIDKVSLDGIQTFPDPNVDGPLPSPQFVPTTSSLLSCTSEGMFLDLPIALNNHVNNGHTGNQSIACWFRAGTWQYSETYSDRVFTIFANASITDHFNRVILQSGKLKVQWDGTTIGDVVDITSWETASWHHICLVQDLVDGISQFKLYVDFVLQDTISVPSATYLFLGQDAIGSGGWTNTLVLGESWDFDTDTGLGQQLVGYISEVVLGPWEFDRVGSRSLSTLDILQESFLNTTSYNVQDFIYSNEEIALYYQGNSSLSYATRCVFFDTTAAPSDWLAFSCYILPETRNYQKLCGYYATYRGVGISSFYGYSNYGWDLRSFLAAQWTRFYIETFYDVAGIGIGIPIGETLYIDGVQLENTLASTSYCDGSQENCSWSGTEDASTSLRTDQILKLPIETTLLNTYKDSWSIVTQFQLPSFGKNFSNQGSATLPIFNLGDGVINTVSIGASVLNSSSLYHPAKVFLSITDNRGFVISNTTEDLYQTILKTTGDSSSTVLRIVIAGVEVVRITLWEDDVVYSNPLPFIFMLACNFGLDNYPTSGNYWENYLAFSIVDPQEDGTLDIMLPSGHTFTMYPHNSAISAVMSPANGITNPSHLNWPQYPDVIVTALDPTNPVNIVIASPYDINVDNTVTPTDVSATYAMQLQRDTIYNLIVVCNHEAKVFNVYLDGILIFSISIVDKILKVPQYLYFGTKPAITPAPVYNSMLVRFCAVFHKALSSSEAQNYSILYNLTESTPGLLTLYEFSEQLDATIGNGINKDVQRLRKKVALTQSPDIAHFQRRANIYVLKLTMKES